MTSLVDIANLALAHLGDAADITSLTERSVQAAHCNRFLPICRDALLELHAWSFSTRRIVPAQLDAWDDTAWPYAYERPSDCLRVLGIYPTGYTNDVDDVMQFLTESNADTDLILTQAEAGALRYTALSTDPDRWSPLFISALARMLASTVAGPLIKGAEGRKATADQWAFFAQEFARATGSDANQANRDIEPIPSWIKARGYTAFSDEDC